MELYLGSILHNSDHTHVASNHLLGLPHPQALQVDRVHGNQNQFLLDESIRDLLGKHLHNMARDRIYYTLADQ